MCVHACTKSIGCVYSEKLSANGLPTMSSILYEGRAQDMNHSSVQDMAGVTAQVVLKVVATGVHVLKVPPKLSAGTH